MRAAPVSPGDTAVRPVESASGVGRSGKAAMKLDGRSNCPSSSHDQPVQQLHWIG
jgi:hypothetical protein